MVMISMKILASWTKIVARMRRKCVDSSRSYQVDNAAQVGQSKLLLIWDYVTIAEARDRLSSCYRHFPDCSAPISGPVLHPFCSFREAGWQDANKEQCNDEKQVRYERSTQTEQI